MTTHTTGQVNSAAEFDRTIALINNGVSIFPSGLTANLKDQVGMEQLTPGLRTFIASLATNVAGFSRLNASGDGSEDSFLLASIPSAGSELVYLGNYLVDTADYSIQLIGNLPYLVFITPPLLGDEIVMVYRSTQYLNATSIGSFYAFHNDISAIFDSTDGLTMLGKRTSAPTGVREVFRININDMSLTGDTPVVVDSISTAERDYPDAIKCGNFVWAIGDSSTGLNKVTKIDVDTLASTGYTLTADTAATISALTTDNTYVYAFMKHSTSIYPNSFIKVAQDGTVSGLIYSGLTVTGGVSTCIGDDGYLYASFDHSSVKQVRRYDISPTGGFAKAFTFTVAPTMICNVDSYIHILAGANLYRLDTSTDVVVLLKTFGSTLDFIHYDGTSLWISSGEILYKCDELGNILQTLSPEPGQNIKTIAFLSAYLWTTYADESGNLNTTKLFAGLLT